MENSEYKVGNYQFSIYKDYEEAKKEAEKILFIKAKVNFTNRKAVQKLYIQLLEKETFHTIVGYEFLNELRKILLQTIKEQEELPIIKIAPMKKLIEPKQTGLERTNEKLEILVNQYKTRSRNFGVIILFCVVIIAIMFFITMRSDNSPMLDYETKILDKYEAWEEKLEAKEKELQQREQKLNDLNK